MLEPGAEMLVAAADVGADDGVLDVAAGDGNVALAAARRGARVIATDLSEVQVQRGRGAASAGRPALAWGRAPHS